MSSMLDLIKPYLSKPKDGITIEINESMHLFSLRGFECKVSTEKQSFLKEMQELAFEEYTLDNGGSAVYFFKAGKNTYIELNISVTDTIDIKPFLIYDDGDIKDDLEEILKLDYLLYCLLKVNEVQK